MTEIERENLAELEPILEARVDGLGYIYLLSDLAEVIGHLSEGERIATCQDIAFARTQAGLYIPGKIKEPNSLWDDHCFVYSEASVYFKGFQLLTRTSPLLKSRGRIRSRYGKSWWRHYKAEELPREEFEKLLEEAQEDKSKEPQERRTIGFEAHYWKDGKPIWRNSLYIPTSNLNKEQFEVAQWLYGSRAKDYLKLMSERGINAVDILLVIPNSCPIMENGHPMKVNGTEVNLPSQDDARIGQIAEMSLGTIYSIQDDMKNRTIRVISDKDYRSNRKSGVELLV